MCDVAGRAPHATLHTLVTAHTCVDTDSQTHPTVTDNCPQAKQSPRRSETHCGPPASRLIDERKS